MKLSEDLKYWRTERPCEWKMDEFIKKSEELEKENSEYLLALELIEKDIDYLKNKNRKIIRILNSIL